MWIPWQGILLEAIYVDRVCTTDRECYKWLFWRRQGVTLRAIFVDRVLLDVDRVCTMERECPQGLRWRWQGMSLWAIYVDRVLLDVDREYTTDRVCPKGLLWRPQEMSLWAIYVDRVLLDVNRIHWVLLPTVWHHDQLSCQRRTSCSVGGKTLAFFRSSASPSHPHLILATSTLHNINTPPFLP